MSKRRTFVSKYSSTEGAKLLLLDVELPTDPATASQLLHKNLAILRRPPNRRSVDDLRKLVDSFIQLSFFKDLEPQIRTQVCRFLKLEQMAEDNLVFREGEPGEKFYIILMGSIGVSVKDMSAQDVEQDEARREAEALEVEVRRKQSGEEARDEHSPTAAAQAPAAAPPAAEAPAAAGSDGVRRRPSALDPSNAIAIGGAPATEVGARAADPKNKKKKPRKAVSIMESAEDLKPEILADKESSKSKMNLGQPMGTIVGRSQTLADKAKQDLFKGRKSWAAGLGTLNLEAVSNAGEMPALPAGTKAQASGGWDEQTVARRRSLALGLTPVAGAKLEGIGQVVKKQDSDTRRRSSKGTEFHLSSCMAKLSERQADGQADDANSWLQRARAPQFRGRPSAGSSHPSSSDRESFASSLEFGSDSDSDSGSDSSAEGKASKKRSAKQSSQHGKPSDASDGSDNNEDNDSFGSTSSSAEADASAHSGSEEEDEGAEDPRRKGLEKMMIEGSDQQKDVEHGGEAEGEHTRKARISWKEDDEEHDKSPKPPAAAPESGSGVEGAEGTRQTLVRKTLLRRMSTRFGVARRQSVVVKFLEIAVLHVGDCFGEVALQNDQPRSATIKTKEECYFATLSREDFQAILHSTFDKQQQERLTFLRSFPLLTGLSEHSINKLSTLMQLRHFTRNEAVYECGTPVMQAYLVKDGSFAMEYRLDAPDPLEDEVVAGATGDASAAGAVPQVALAKRGSLATVVPIKPKLPPPQPRSVREKYITAAVLLPPTLFGLTAYLRGERKRSDRVVCKSVTGSIYCVLAKELLHYLSRDRRSRLQEMSKIQDMFYKNRCMVMRELAVKPKGASNEQSHLARAVSGARTARGEETPSMARARQLAMGQVEGSIYSIEGRLNRIGKAFTKQWSEAGASGSGGAGHADSTAHGEGANSTAATIGDGTGGSAAAGAGASPGGTADGSGSAEKAGGDVAGAGGDGLASPTRAKQAAAQGRGFGDAVHNDQPMLKPLWHMEEIPAAVVAIRLPLAAPRVAGSTAAAGDALVLLAAPADTSRPRPDPSGASEKLPLAFRKEVIHWDGRGRGALTQERHRRKAAGLLQNQMASAESPCQSRAGSTSPQRQGVSTPRLPMSSRLSSRSRELRSHSKRSASKRSASKLSFAARSPSKLSPFSVSKHTKSLSKSRSGMAQRSSVSSAGSLSPTSRSPSCVAAARVSLVVEDDTAEVATEGDDALWLSPGRQPSHRSIEKVPSLLGFDDDGATAEAAPGLAEQSLGFLQSDDDELPSILQTPQPPMLPEMQSRQRQQQQHHHQKQQQQRLPKLEQKVHRGSSKAETNEIFSPSSSTWSPTSAKRLAACDVAFGFFSESMVTATVTPSPAQTQIASTWSSCDPRRSPREVPYSPRGAGDGDRRLPAVEMSSVYSMPKPKSGPGSGASTSTWLPSTGTKFSGGSSRSAVFARMH
mmetsp:Transcript_67787/g.220662  ORF Transcript_67787/g.220662 Transcript_67787/m.220662 type:complete len:1456 (-) Transcript_67787:653-5020(-)